MEPEHCPTLPSAHLVGILYDAGECSNVRRLFAQGIKRVAQHRQRVLHYCGQLLKLIHRRRRGLQRRENRLGGHSESELGGRRNVCHVDAVG